MKIEVKMKNVLKSLAKSVLIPLGLTVAASAADADIQNNVFGSGMTTLIISKKEMDDIIKIVKSLKEFVLLMKGVSKTIKNEAKEQKGWFLCMFLGTLGASLLGNLLRGNDVKAEIVGRGVMNADEGIIRAGEDAIKANQDF